LDAHQLWQGSLQHSRTAAMEQYVAVFRPPNLSYSQLRQLLKTFSLSSDTALQTALQWTMP